MNIADLSSIELIEQMKSGALGVSAVTKHFLDASRAHAELNALTYLADEHVRTEATRLEGERASGRPLGLHKRVDWWRPGVAAGAKLRACRPELPRLLGLMGTDVHATRAWWSFYQRFDVEHSVPLFAVDEAGLRPSKHKCCEVRALLTCSVCCLCTWPQCRKE